MQFDIVTLLAVHGAATLALEGLLVVFWLSHRRVSGLGLWTVGNGLAGAASLAAAQRAYLPDMVASVLCNLALFLGMLLVWNGVRAFNGRPGAWRGSWTAFALFGAALAQVVLVSEDFHARVILTSIAYAGVLFLTADELVRYSRPRMRRIAWAAATLFLAQGTTFALRAGHALLSPDESSASTLTPGFLLLAIIMSVLLVSCLVMLAAQRLQSELEVALEREEAASRGKSEFLALMSHELRTPLNAILGFSDVMKQQLFGPLGSSRYQAYADDIHASGTHLLDLISTLLDVSKAEAGKLEVAPEWLDAARIGRAVARLLGEAAAKKGVKLDCPLPETLPACWADERALKQILLNLLSNAIKFTPAGGRITLGMQGDADGGFRISVADTGIGIASAEIPRLLKPFEQVSNTYSAAQGGTGLGLPMVDALVRLHGGRLDIASRPGAGTEVTVWLPPGSRRLATAA